MKSKLLLLLCFVMLSQLTFAQGKLSIDNVYALTLRNSGTINDGDEIKGYYLFYQSDKIDKKFNEFTLRILDQNLRIANDIKFIDSKNLRLMEAAYNGDKLMFAFHDIENKSHSYRVYGTDGKIKTTYTTKLSKGANLYHFIENMNSEMNNIDRTDKNLYSIDMKGYISLIPTNNFTSSSFSINYYGSAEENQWTYTPESRSNYMTEADVVGFSEREIFIEEIKTKTNMMGGGNIESWLLCLDIKTGKKVYEVLTKTNEIQFLPITVMQDSSENETKLIGLYYKSDAYVTKAKPLGIVFITLNKSGEVKKETRLSWENEFSKFLKTNAYGKIEDIGYLYFHEIIKSSNGKYYAITEGFTKADDGAGKALGVYLGSTNVPAKIKTTDMLMIELNENFTINDIKIYPKNPNYYMVAGGAFMTPHMASYQLKLNYGGFDYDFFQGNKDRSNFVIGYTNVKKSNERVEEVSLNTITFYNGEFTTDKINLETNATRIRVLPAKLGSVLIMEYFKKEKKLELRLEKIN